MRVKKPYGSGLSRYFVNISTLSEVLLPFIVSSFAPFPDPDPCFASLSSLISLFLQPLSLCSCFLHHWMPHS